MEEPHLGDFTGHKLKDIYNNNEDEKLLVLEFDNNYKLLIRGVGEPNFLIKKQKGDPETKEEKRKKEKEKQAALKERKTKEAKQKNRPKKK